MAVQRNDILWKSAIEDFLKEFLQFIYPDADKIFDFSKKPKFLNKELAELVAHRDMKDLKRIDSLVELSTLDQKEELVYIHIEVQGSSKKDFTARVFRYFYRLLDRYERPVSCIVIYLGKSNDCNASFFQTQFLDTKVRMDFKALYVGEMSEEELRKNRNPFAVVMLTALIALKHKKKIEQLFNSKIALVRNLFNRGYDKKKIGKLLNFIDLYVNFEESELNAKFDRKIELINNKKLKTMGIMEAARLIRRLEAEEKLQISIAQKMKKLGISNSFIVKSTGLRLKQVRAL